MDLMTKTREKIGAAEPGAALTPTVLDEAGILIVCDDDSDTETLRAIFREAKFTLECAKTITAGCEAAASGRFQVVLSVPLLNDGSWRRLIDLAHHQDLNFEVVLLARNFDLNQWAEALNDRSEEHTSELQSPCNLVCRLLLEKKKCTLASPLRPTAPRKSSRCTILTWFPRFRALI